MAITACGDEYTEEDKEALHEAEKGYDSTITQEVWGEFFEQHMPEVERAIEERFDHMMEQKNTEFVERANEIIERGESTFSEFIPSDNELLKKSLRDLPLKPATLEERITIRELGKELGLSPARYVNTADIVRFPTRESVREIMAFLNHPEMPRSFVRRESIGQIQYVNIPQYPILLGIRALTLIMKPEFVMKAMLELEDKGEIEKAKEMGIPGEKTLGIFIFPDEKGQVPTGKSLVNTLAHEVVVHGNWPRIREYIREHKTDFDRVMARQIEKQGLPAYPLRQLVEDTEEILKAESGKIPPLSDQELVEIKGGLDRTRETRLLKETVAKMSEFYFTDRTQLVPEAQKWFGDMLKYFRGE